MNRRGFGLWALALLGSGCATPRRSAGDAAWTGGRLSVRIAATAQQPAQSVSADFELRGSGPQGELRLSSPLGIRMATATWAPGLARLVSADGDKSFASLEELSRQSFGENLPLAALPDWLAGRPWADVPHSATTEGFEQLGWQVNLVRQSEGWIEARRAAPPEVLVRVRLDKNT